MSAHSIATRNLSTAPAFAYSRFCKAAGWLQTPFLLAIRLYWGWQFAQTGLGKVEHLDKVTNFFSSLGLPFPAFSAAIVGGTELLGGVFLVLGLGSRIWALLLAADMVGAYLTDGKQELHHFFSDPSKFYNYDAFTFLLAALLVLVFGPGRLALDELLRRRWTHVAD